MATDLYLYVTLAADGACATPGVLAASTACFFDAATNRPLLGSLQLCPAVLAAQPGSAAAALAPSVVLHELLHLLGFNEPLFSLFIDSSGVLLPRTSVVGVVQRSSGPIFAITTPAVAAAAQAHFGCGTLPVCPPAMPGLTYCHLPGMSMVCTYSVLASCALWELVYSSGM
jgi:hypothetical protein